MYNFGIQEVNNIVKKKHGLTNEKTGLPIPEYVNFFKKK